MIYLYAIADGWPGSARGALGFAGAPLRAVVHDGIAGVYSDAPPRLEPTEDALLLHERVLEELMADQAVLPLRFGSRLAGVDELRELLSARCAEFAAALARVRGRVEIGVRATVPDPGASAEDGSGRAYLTAKLDRRRVAARIGDDLHAELAPLASDSTYRVIGDPQPTFAGAYLVDRERVDSFRRAFETARAARPEVAAACTGPWPPFNFTAPGEAA